MPKATLSKIHRTFIVTRFAEFDSATDIQKALKETFDVDVTLPAVTHYNPEANKSLGQKYRDLFDETRKRFVEDTSNIAIAQKAYRLRELQKHYHRQASAARVNPVELRATLEQAARESGNAFTNRREITAADGKSIVPEGSNVILFLPDNGRGDADKTPANNAGSGVVDGGQK